MREVISGHRTRIAVLLGAALAFRLFLAISFPHVGGDSPIYEAYARNLLRYGVYSHLEAQDHQPPAPSMIRAPGYPLFLAAIFAVAGERNETAVRVVQAVLDTFTCLLIALMVFELSSGEEAQRKRLAHGSLLLAAVCPFVANYSASILSEVPTTFFLTAATLLAVRALKNSGPQRRWFFCGLLTGVATLFRPESGLWVVAVGLLLELREGARRRWRPALVGSALMAVGLMVALSPWTVRNLVTLKQFQPLAPVYAQDPEEFVPRGYFDWCRTWLWRFREVDAFIWTVEETDIPLDSLPATATDDPRQRDQILDLLRRHNESHSLDRFSDSEFEAIARERIHRHPVRYFIFLPALRTLALWFTPRVEVLPLEGRLLPFAAAWENDPRDFLFTLLLFTVNLVYVALALVGTWRIFKIYPSSDSAQLLGAYLFLSLICLRTIFFAYFAFPEPRYMVEVYPEVIGLAAFSFAPHAA